MATKKTPDKKADAKKAKADVEANEPVEAPQSGVIDEAHAGPPPAGEAPAVTTETTAETDVETDVEELPGGGTRITERPSRRYQK
ncbi:MAG: hypothetical protein M3P06_11410 [Acidobacteriota bacterium]|nr:hypothetical protein [Acidobacteriota bacterium]